MALGSTVLYDADASVTTTATADGRLLLTGGDGPLLADKQRPAAHVQRTGQLMYECLKRFPAIVGLVPEFGWSTPVVAGPDRFPLIGPHRQYPHQLFAFGTDRDPALAWMASRILARAVPTTKRPPTRRSASAGCRRTVLSTLLAEVVVVPAVRDVWAPKGIRFADKCRFNA